MPVVSVNVWTAVWWIALQMNVDITQELEISSINWSP
jgi:hypothetical protein